jgi:hypothetical protein
MTRSIHSTLNSRIFQKYYFLNRLHGAATGKPKNASCILPCLYSQQTLYLNIMNKEFENQCQLLGQACAKAKMRLDEKAPASYQTAFKTYKGPKTFLSYFERKCLSLRLSAIKRGMLLDPAVDVKFIENITQGFCPVTLVIFDTESKSASNPSVDRLVNEGTYAAGNIMMLSIRANRAKGEKSFEEIAEIATAGLFRDGLEGVEWMRLTTLMYGAWSIGVRGADPYLLPLATYPGPKMFSAQSQVVQLQLLRLCHEDAHPDSIYIWLHVTTEAESSVAEFLSFIQLLKDAVIQEDYKPNAWLHPGVFDGFVIWYNACHRAIDEMYQPFYQKYQGDVDFYAITDKWRVGHRYLN